MCSQSGERGVSVTLRHGWQTRSPGHGSIPSTPKEVSGKCFLLICLVHVRDASHNTQQYLFFLYLVPGMEPRASHMLKHSLTYIPMYNNIFYVSLKMCDTPLFLIVEVILWFNNSIYRNIEYVIHNPLASPCSWAVLSLTLKLWPFSNIKVFLPVTSTSPRGSRGLTSGVSNTFTY